MFASVPGQMDRIGAQGGLRCEAELATVEVGELEMRASGEDGLGDVGLGHADTKVIIDSPETCVEEIVGGRGQC